VALQDPLDGPRTYELTYDDLGNVTQDHEFAFTWDASGRLASAEDSRYVADSALHPAPRRVLYLYDALGRRVARLYEGQEAGTWPDERVVYDGLQPIEERSLDGSTVFRRYWNPPAVTAPLVVEENLDLNSTVDGSGDAQYALLTDDRGTVMGVAGPTGALVEKLFYNATGVAKSASPGGTIAQDAAGHPVAHSRAVRFGWCGMLREPFTGLYHTHFREYSNLHGRWLSEDPAGYADGLNLYAYCGGDAVNAVDALGLASEDVPPELLERVQSIADELVEIMPTWVKEAGPQERGTWLHTQLESRLGDLDNVLIIAESSIDGAGRIASRGTRGNPIPDIIFLKSGANREGLLSGTESLVGHVDAVADLKTGFKGIETRWGQSVGQRLGLGLEDIHRFAPGGSLVDDFARAPAVRGLASRLVKRGAVRTAGRAIIIAGVLFAYQHAKAEGMDDSQAAAYAAASVYGGDLVYDGTRWLSDLSWNAANDFARGSSAGQYVQAIESALNGQYADGPTVDASGRKLDAILRTRTPTAGDSLLLIDR
jgi:RHS repeat-associated protein